MPAARRVGVRLARTRRSGRRPWTGWSPSRPCRRRRRQPSASTPRPRHRQIDAFHTSRTRPAIQAGNGDASPAASPRCYRLDPPPREPRDDGSRCDRGDVAPARRRADPLHVGRRTPRALRVPRRGVRHGPGHRRPRPRACLPRLPCSATCPSSRRWSIATRSGPAFKGYDARRRPRSATSGSPRRPRRRRARRPGPPGLDARRGGAVKRHRQGLQGPVRRVLPGRALPHGRRAVRDMTARFPGFNREIAAT